MAPLVRGEVPEWDDTVFMQISESQVGRAVRTPKWKYSVRAPGKDGWKDMDSDVYEEEFLYDLENDPNELHNLVSDGNCAAVREEMKALLLRKMEEAGETRPRILPKR